MRNLLLILTAVLLSSCFSGITDDNSVSIDPILKVYVDNFFKEAEMRGRIIPHHDLSVRVEQGRKHKGDYYEVRKVAIFDRDFIMSHLLAKTKADSNFVMLAVWHELGHFTGQKHRAGLSIMNSGDPSEGAGDFVGTMQTFNRSFDTQEVIKSELFYPNE